MSKTEISKQAFDFLRKYNEGIPTPPVVFHTDLATSETITGFRGERFMES